MTIVRLMPQSPVVPVSAKNVEFQVGSERRTLCDPEADSLNTAVMPLQVARTMSFVLGR